MGRRLDGVMRRIKLDCFAMMLLFTWELALVV